MTLWLPGLGMVGAVLLLAWGLFISAPPTTLPPGAIASVNGRPIPANIFHAAVDNLSEGPQGLAPEKLRNHVLGRLIDEELLLQKALALELPFSDRTLRTAIVQAMIALILQQNLALTPEAGEVERFYQENPGLFVRAERLQLAYIRLPAPASAQAAELAEKLAAGGDFAAIQAEVMPSPLLPLPDVLLPLSAISAYLGGELAEQASQMQAGEWAGPFFQQDGIYFLYLKARRAEGLPPLAEIYQQVEIRWRREQDDSILRRELEMLRQQATIRRLDALP